MFGNKKRDEKINKLEEEIKEIKRVLRRSGLLYEYSSCDHPDRQNDGISCRLDEIKDTLADLIDQYYEDKL